MLKDSINFFLNGERLSLETRKIKHISLLDVLREELSLTGTKKSCSEGDCGACTVVIGEFSPLTLKVVYKAITSCIYPVFKIEGKHVITIEGLQKNNGLTEIQKAFIEHNAIQCGFCTPGFIMSLLALFLNNPYPDKDEIEKALSGNLCRCTGYKSIKEASFSIKKFKKPNFIKDVEKELIPQRIDSKFNLTFPNTPINRYYIPSNLNSALKILKKGNITVASGFSDLMIPINKGALSFDTVMDLSEIDELKEIILKDNRVIVKAGITFSQFINFLKTKGILTELIPYFELIGSEQIRNIATICGNIGNASPIADSAIIFLALNSKLTILGPDGKREIRLDDFYIDYKKTSIENNEIIEGIEFQIPKGKLSFLKTSKRREVDIASVNSCILLEKKESIVKEIKISFGGVFPYPARIKRGEEFMKDKIISLENIEKLADICKGEVKPISDVRGSAKFRKQLVYNHIVKHFLKLAPEAFNE